MKKQLLLLFLGVFLLLGCRDVPKLYLDGSSQLSYDSLFPDTEVGELIKQHILLSTGHGEDAEERYQQSVEQLRNEPGAAETIYKLYEKTPPENYFFRTLLVESLKQCKSENALALLNEIASSPIPEDAQPENTEWNTTEDEIVIRITAVEGITLMALDSLKEAEERLFKLIDHHDLTVRQMATRGYLTAPFGDLNEKIAQLQRKLPKEEHWYIVVAPTDIRRVEHPDFPEKFDLDTGSIKNSPKIN